MKRLNCSTALIAAAAAVLGALPAAAQEEVTVTLNWTAGGDHAPIYWAQEQGWYADAGLDLYLSVKHNAAAWEELEAVADWLRAEVPAGWRVHLNGNNLAVLPPFLDKAHAVRWFRNRIAGPHPFAIGLGDSLSDVEFLLACDIAALPAGAQLAQRLAGG